MLPLWQWKIFPFLQVELQQPKWVYLVLRQIVAQNQVGVSNHKLLCATQKSGLGSGILPCPIPAWAGISAPFALPLSHFLPVLLCPLQTSALAEISACIGTGRLTRL